MNPPSHLSPREPLQSDLPHPAAALQAPPIAQMQELEAAIEIERAPLSRVSVAEEVEESENGVFDLITASQLALQLHHELIPERLQELVTTPRWAEILVASERIKERLESCAFDSFILSKNYEVLETLISTGREWERYLQDPENETPPFRGDLSVLSEEETFRLLPEFLSAARAEVRKLPEEINMDFIHSIEEHLINRDYRRFQEVHETLDLAKALHALVEDGLHQRMEPQDQFAQAAARLGEIVQELSPERIAELANNQRWEGLMEEASQIFRENIPLSQKRQFGFFYGDRLEVIILMEKVCEEWQRHLENPQDIEPYQGEPVVLEGISPQENQNLCRRLLSAAREEIRKFPEQIDLARLLEINGIVDSLRARENPNRALPQELSEIIDSIKIAKGLKEIHTEGYFQRRQAAR